MPVEFTAPPAEYDVSFGHLCNGTTPMVLELLAEHVAVGSSLLDVGTGTGRFADAAAQTGYRLTAVDPSAEMIDFARERRPRQGVTWVVAGSPTLPFADGQFDVAVANFVVNHVGDPRAVVRDVHRVVRLGGPVVSTIWGGPTALSDLWDQVIHASDAARPAAARLPRYLDFGRSEAGLVALHREAGADVVASGELAWTFVVGPVDLWRAVEAGVAGIGSIFWANPPPVRETMAAVFLELAGSQARDGLLHLPIRAPYVLART